MTENTNKSINSEKSELFTDAKKRLAHKFPHRRSLSGSSVLSKTWNCRIKGDSTGKKLLKFKLNRDNRSGTTMSELECREKSVNSLSSSSGNNFQEIQKISTSSSKSDNSKDTIQQSKSQPVSAKRKIKHFLTEHLVIRHHCHHPEYHCHKKDASMVTSCTESNDLHGCDHHRTFGRDSPNTTQLTQRSRSYHDINNVSGIDQTTSDILERIRNINIQPMTSPVDQERANEICEATIKMEEENNSQSQKLCNDFPFPEPNPNDLPNVISPCSIDFSQKHILSEKPKFHILSHSMSYDQRYKLADFCKNAQKKHLNYEMSLVPKFVPEKDKWEKKISGYLDTSTSTGATLTAINFGLKRVTETDKYLMITKSPTSNPNEFLEDGINHIGDSSEIFESLMRHSTCYDVMPDSGKVVIINSQIEIERAFDAVEENIVRAAPIWSSAKQSFIALLNVTDLVPLLLHLHQRNIHKDNCSESDGDEDPISISVDESLSIIPRFRSLQNHIVHVTPETNLRTANSLFNHFHKTTLLVIDSFLSGNPLFLLTGLRILAYLYFKAHNISDDSCFATKISSSTLLNDQNFEPLKELEDSETLCDRINGLYQRRVQYFVRPSASIINVLRAMGNSYHCCALVTDEVVVKKLTITEVITMADILNLIKIQKHKDLTITASDILNYRREYSHVMTYRDPVISCDIDRSVSHLIHEIVKEKASFVIVRCANQICRGLITVHEVLTYIDSLPYKITEMDNNLHKKNQSKSTIYSINRFSPANLDEFEEETIDCKLPESSEIKQN